MSYAGCVTKDPDTDLHNVGVYRGMVVDRDRIAVLMWRAQNWGSHFTMYEERGEEMPVAFVVGWENRGLQRELAAFTDPERRFLAARHPRFGTSA